ncbi:hypothetical protein CJ030_MR1G014080 [Morella rubra]|uniref:Uncharacterized protein n=1 Tax=Morella rubra TaxID=262757 RepID=A0A6A1WRU7_9ROSI|nr:hypothetical protein CJ030_MR1G014080 [Morella rubra]
MDPDHDEAPLTTKADKDQDGGKYLLIPDIYLVATRRRQLRDETHSQTIAEAHSIHIPHLRDETPSQSDDVPPPPIVPLTRSRRLSQLLGDNIGESELASLHASRKKTAQAPTPYCEPPSMAPIETHTVRLNRRQSSTSSSLHVTGVASRIRIRRSSRLQAGIDS